MKISIQPSGLKELQVAMKDMSDRRIKAVLATALTRTAVKVRNKVKESMLQSLDRPTPYTMRQLNYVAATAQRTAAAVGFGVIAINDQYGDLMSFRDVGASETPAGKYLHGQIEGGPRRNKRFEKALQAVGALPPGWYAVPGERAKMDAFGNQSVGEIRQILSWFDAAELVAGSTQNMGERGRQKRIKGTKRTAGFAYFLVRSGDTRSFTRASGKSGSHKMQPGIYRRTLHGLGGQISPIVIFVKSINYKRRFDFYGIAKEEGDRVLPMEIRQATEESLARMNARTP